MSKDSDKSKPSIGGALTPESTPDNKDQESTNEETQSIRQRLEEQGVNPDEVFVNGLRDEDEDNKEEEVSKEQINRELITDYIDFKWDEQISQAREKIDKASEGDKQAYADVSAAPRRVKDYFTTHKIPRDTLLDGLLPLTLVIYGVILFGISIIIGGARFTEPSRLADMFILDTIVLMITVFTFIYLRQQSDPSEDSKVDIVRRRLREAITVLHLLPSLALIWIIYEGLTSGLQGINDGVWWFMARLQYWASIAPEPIANAGTWIWTNTPIGVSVQQTAILMFVSGLVGALPFVLAMFKVLLIAINVGFRGEIQEEDEERDLMDAVKGIGEISGARTETKVEPEDFQPDNNSSQLQESDASEREDKTESELLDKVTDNMLEYKEPDDLLEPHPDYQMTEYGGEYKEIERYWLKEPYSYAVILYSEKNDDHRYFAVEPQLDESESEIYRQIQDRLETALRSDSIDSKYEEDMVDEKKKEILEERVFEIATEYDIELSDLTLQKIMYYIERDYIGYRHIDVLMNDINAEDISCLGPNEPIWINHSNYENIITNIQFNKRPLQRFISQLAQRSGEQISAADPMQDATLPDGSRAQLTLGDDVTTHGSTFTIRQFQEIPFTPVDLIGTNTFSLDQMAYLWLAIQNNQSLIFAGGTASGKTTSMNALSLFIPPKSKVITIEDTREISLPHDNWIPGKSREGTSQDENADDAISMYDLLKAALRQRPEYLVVGEVRGEEAQTLFQAMSTGHTTYSTMHADSVEEAIHRLENDPINVPEKMVNNLDIICIQRRIIREGEATRRNITITEIEDSDKEGHSHNINHVFKYDPATDDWLNETEDSSVLEFIRSENAMSDKELRDELERRKKVLEYLSESEVVQFNAITKAIQQYMNTERENIDEFMKKVENGELNPLELDDITDIDLDNIEQHRHKDKTEEILGY